MNTDNKTFSDRLFDCHKEIGKLHEYDSRVELSEDDLCNLNSIICSCKILKEKAFSLIIAEHFEQSIENLLNILPEAAQNLELVKEVLGDCATFTWGCHYTKEDREHPRRPDFTNRENLRRGCSLVKD